MKEMEMFVMFVCILVSRGLTGAQDYSEFEKMLAGEPENEAKTVELGPEKPQGAEETNPEQSERTKSEDYSEFEKMLAEEPEKNEAKTDKLGSANAQETGGPKSQMGDKNEGQEAGGPKSEMGDKNEAKESGGPKSQMGDKNEAQEAQDEGIGKEPEISNDDDVDKAIREMYEEAIALDIKEARPIQEHNIVVDLAKKLHELYRNLGRSFSAFHPEMIIKQHILTYQAYEEVWSESRTRGDNANFGKYSDAVRNEWKVLKTVVALFEDEVGKLIVKDYKRLRILLPPVGSMYAHHWLYLRSFEPEQSETDAEFASLEKFIRKPNKDMVVNVSKRSLAKEDNVDKRSKEATVREQAPEDEIIADVVDRRTTVKDTAAKGNEKAAKGGRSEEEVVARLDAAKTDAEVLGKSSGDSSSESVTTTPNAATEFGIFQHHSVLQIAILSSVVVPLILAMIIVVAYRKNIKHWYRKDRTIKETEMCRGSNQISGGGLESLMSFEPSAKHSAEREGGERATTLTLAAIKPKD